MSWLDGVIAIVILAGFVHGLLKGAIQEIFMVLALVIGVIAAGRMASGTDAITSQLSHATIGKIFVFAITFLIVAIIVGLIGKLFTGLAKAANLRTIDRLIGGVVGACLAGIAVGVVLSIALRLGMDPSGIEGSPLAQQLVNAVGLLAGFLPKAKSAVETALLQA